MARNNTDSWKQLADEVDASQSGDPSLYLPPDFDPDPAKNNFWLPDLGPTQQKIFNDPAPVLLAAGSKGR